MNHVIPHKLTAELEVIPAGKNKCEEEDHADGIRKEFCYVLKNDGFRGRKSIGLAVIIIGK